MNVYSLTEWYITYWRYVVSILLNQMSLSIKVMQLVLFRWRQVILNAIFCIKMVLFHRSYGHMNICKLSTCDNLEEIFTKVYYTPHLICVEYIGTKSLQVSGGESLVSLINNLLKTSYCILFFVWVFPFVFFI